MEKLSTIVRHHRKAAFLTQAELAKTAGVGKTAVWDIEHDKESIRWDTLQKVLSVLNITWQWHSPLLERERSKTPSTSTSTSPSR